MRSAWEIFRSVSVDSMTEVYYLCHIHTHAVFVQLLLLLIFLFGVVFFNKNVIETKMMHNNKTQCIINLELRKNAVILLCDETCLSNINHL